MTLTQWLALYNSINNKDKIREMKYYVGMPIIYFILEQKTILKHRYMLRMKNVIKPLTKDEAKQKPTLPLEKTWNTPTHKNKNKDKY